jgi:hypothetical protein
MPELFGVIQQMMRSDPVLRVEIQEIVSHPIVCRARSRMAASGEGPLSPPSREFLEEILCRMDVRM